jgi:WD40 repeat protein
MRLRLVAVGSLVALAPLLSTLPSTASAQPASIQAAAKPAIAKPAAAPAAIHAAPLATPLAATTAVAVPKTPVRTHAYDGGLLQGSSATKVTLEDFSSAAVGNVTGHRDGDTDVVAGYVDGTLHVWDQRTNRQEFVVQTGGPIRSAPALVRTHAGGGLVVLTSNTAGNVLIYGFGGGKAVLIFHKHVAPIGNPSVNGFFGTPTMADLDNNGKAWIIATSWDQHLYVWDIAGNTKPGFPFFAQDTIWSSPTVAKMDGDPYPRIVFGYDCSGVPGESCYARWHSHGGVLMSLEHTGKPTPGFPVFLPGQTEWSTPAVTSLYGTAAKQIVIGTGLYWPNAGQVTYVYDASGHRLAAIPMTGRTFSSPAIGDVLHLGHPQIVIGSEDGYTDIIDNTFHRRAHTCTSILTGCAVSHSSPIIGDLYNNGQQEIVGVGGNHFVIIDHTGLRIASVQIPETVFGLAASPTLVNISGKATLFFATMARGAGGAHAEVYAYTFQSAAGLSAWPMFKADATRSGTVAKRTIPVPVP